MKALIYAAGLGTRLKPYTDSMPKALVPLNGKPMLWHQVQKLKAAGVDELVINVHHFADQVVDYVHSEGDFGLSVHFSDERDMLLDTGGGLLHAREFLDAGNEPFLIHNVDIFSNLDLKKFIDDNLGSRDVAAKLLTSDRPSSRKLLFDASGRLRGWKNLTTGQMKGPAAMMPDASYAALAFGGVHLLSPRIFEYFDKLGFEGCFSIIDFYLAACDSCNIVCCQQDGLRLVDAGKPETLADAISLIG